VNAPVAVEEAVVPEVNPVKTPRPTGWRLLCAVPKMETKFQGTSIVRPDANVQQEQFATVVMFVVDMGPDCYTDKARYPNGPYCKVGDFIMCRQYSGTRFRVAGEEFRLLNEDQVEAVVDDPRAISRV